MTTTKGPRKTLLPILVFFVTLALGGTAVFVAQKIKRPLPSKEPPTKLAEVPGPPAPTTPVPSEAAAPPNTCNSAECECAFTATAAPTKPSCSLLSITPTEGLTNQEFTANITCQSGSTAYYVVYLMTRKRGTTTKVRLTLDTLCTGSGTCTKSFKFTPNATTRGLPALTEAGTYDLWITARSAGPDGVGGNDDDLACTDIPDDLREATSPVACGQKGKTFVLTAALSCTLDASKITLTAGEATTLSATGAGGKSPYTFDQWAISPTGGNLSGTTGASVTWTSPSSLSASTVYTATVRVKDSFSPTRTATCQKTLTVNPATITHKACSNNTCVTVSGAGSNECQTDADCQATTHKVCQNYTCTTVTGAGTNQCQTDNDCQGGNQKPLCGKINAEPATGNAPLTVTFTVTGAKDNDGTVVVYEFDFGDESGKTVSQNSTTHTYQNVGTYETRVWVRDNLSLRSDLTDDCRVTVKTYLAGAAVPPTTPPPVTPPPTVPGAATPPAASPSAAPTGSREMTLFALLGGLMAILLGGWWYAHLDPAWQKFEKGLTRFWERK